MIKRLAAVLMTLAVLPLAACSLLGSGVQQFTVGECVSFDVELTDEPSEVGELPILDCTEPHDGEVYFIHSFEGDEYPADVLTTADEVCFNEFESYVGAPYETSSLDIQYLYPTESSWDLGDREVVCIVVPLEGQLSEVVKGSGL